MEVPTTLCSGSINLLEQLTELGETLTFASLLKDIITDTDEQPVEEVQRMRSGRVLNTGPSVNPEVGVHLPPGVDVFTTWNCSNPILLGFYGGFPCRHDQLF